LLVKELSKWSLLVIRVQKAMNYQVLIDVFLPLQSLWVNDYWDSSIIIVAILGAEY